MVIPVVKKETKNGRKFKTPEKITYSYKTVDKSNAARLGAEAFASFAEGAELFESGAFVVFELDESLENKAEIYRVVISSDGIRVGFRDERGALNGAATVALMLRKELLEEGEILDYPSCAYRSFMIDMARGLPTYEDIEMTVRYMALAKFNRLHLHLIDSKGPCYLSDAVPEYKFIGRGEACDKVFLRRIAELCRSYSIEIIPEIEVPAHATALCKAHPEFKCDVEDAHDWTLCPGSEGIWEFFDALIGEIADIFPESEYIHIGSDEIELLDFPKPKKCHWAECPKCAALREKNRLADRQSEFYCLIERIYGIVRAYGKKMIMWNDQIDVSKNVPESLSRDILIEFWRIAAPGRGPYEGCTFEKFLEQGFNIVNAYYPYAYFESEESTSAEKLKDWTPFNEPEQSEKYASLVLGGEACAWEFGNYQDYPFYSYVTPSVVAMFGDKLWGLGSRDYSDESAEGRKYREALSEFIFGSAEYTDVFDFVGGLIPPRSAEKFTYADVDKISRDRLLECINRVGANKTSPVSEKYVYLLSKIEESVK